jgi:hypothetical protein
MSNQLVCDKCEKPIDQEQPYFTLTVVQVKAQVDEGGAATGGTEVVEPAKTYDYHANHLPKILGDGDSGA